MDCGAGWYPARRLATGAGGLCTGGSGRVTNPPDPEGTPSNLPHNFRRIPVPGKTKWHWAACLLRITRDTLPYKVGKFNRRLGGGRRLQSTYRAFPHCGPDRRY